MDYKKIYNGDYFSGKKSFFYKFGGYASHGSSKHFELLYKNIKYLVDPNKQGSVLDIGCAYGIVLSKFPKKWEKYGIDVSEHAISEAKKRFPEIKFKVGEAEKQIPFTQKFDIIMMHDVIEHLEKPEIAIKNVYNSLYQGGIFYITTPNKNIFRKIIYKVPDRIEHHISLQTQKELIQKIEKLNFRIIKKETFTNVLSQVFVKFKNNIGVEQLIICQKK